MSASHDEKPAVEAHSGEPEATKISKITLLDLGDKQYGDCVLCQFGNRTVLIDGSHSGDEAHILRQLKWLLGQNQNTSSVRVSLLIVTHPHEDHIGCLPRLVAKGQLQADFALVADPQFRWGTAQETESLFAGSNSRERALSEALLEEDRSKWPDGELERFIENAGSLSSRYRTMLDQLRQNTTQVVYSGSDQVADLEAEFADIGFRLIGPQRDHLEACYALLKPAHHESLGFAEEAFATDETMDVVSAYRSFMIDVAEWVKPNKGAINLQSLVTHFQYGEHKFLFAGDMQFSEPEVENQMLVDSVHRMRDEISGEAPYSFVKLSHHASYNGFNDDVLSELGETALFGICCGHYDDTNTHPHQDVLKLLDDNRETLQWVRTDHNRQVRMTFGASAKPEIKLTSGYINDASLNHEVGEGISEALAPVVAEVPAIAANNVVEILAKVPANATRITVTVDLAPNVD